MVQVLGGGGSTPKKPTPNPRQADRAAGMDPDARTAGPTSQQIRDWVAGSSGGGAPTWPTTYPTSGGGGGGGGGYGGGGGGGGGVSQADTNAMLAALRAARPKPIDYQRLRLQQYDAPQMGAFDTGMYDRARTGITQGVAADRSRASSAYDGLAGTLGGQSNAYAGGPSGMASPGMRDAMLRMMQAQGLDPSGVSAELGYEAAGQNASLSAVYDLLARAETEAQQSRERQLGMDREYANASLDDAARNLGLGVDMAQGRASSEYDQRLFDYNAAVAQRRNDIANQQIMANYQGRNATNQANVTLQNNYNSSILASLLDLIRESGANIDINGLFG